MANEIPTLRTVDAAARRCVFRYPPSETTDIPALAFNQLSRPARTSDRPAYPAPYGCRRPLDRHYRENDRTHFLSGGAARRTDETGAVVIPDDFTAFRAGVPARKLTGPGRKTFTRPTGAGPAPIDSADCPEARAWMIRARIARGADHSQSGFIHGANRNG